MPFYYRLDSRRLSLSLSPLVSTKKRVLSPHARGIARFWNIVLLLFIIVTTHSPVIYCHKREREREKKKGKIHVVSRPPGTVVLPSLHPPSLLLYFFLLHLSFSLTRLSIVFFALLVPPPAGFPSPPFLASYQRGTNYGGYMGWGDILFVRPRAHTHHARTHAHENVYVRRRRPAFCTGSISTRDSFYSGDGIYRTLLYRAR